MCFSVRNLILLLLWWPIDNLWLLLGGWHHKTAISSLELASCWWLVWDLEANYFIVLLLNFFIVIPHETNPYPRSDHIHGNLPPSPLFWQPPWCLYLSWWWGWSCTLDPLAPPHFHHYSCHVVPFRRVCTCKHRPQRRPWECDCTGSTRERCDHPMCSNPNALSKIPRHRLHWISFSLRGQVYYDTFRWTLYCCL